MLKGMTATHLDSYDHPVNVQAFETCVTSAIRIVAALEFGALLGEERPTREMIFAFAGEIDRHAADLAVMAGEGAADVRAQGRAWYEQLSAARDEPVQLAYHAVHAAVFLGLPGGMNTARILSAVGYALCVLAQREGRLTN